MKPTLLMQTAYLVSQESKCVSWKVGAIIVKDGRIISTGVNGSPAGGHNCCDHARTQKWIKQNPHQNKKYLVKDFRGYYYDTDTEATYDHAFEIPEEAHIALKTNRSVDFYKNVNGTAYLWHWDDKDWIYTNQFFSNIVARRKIVWRSPNLDKNLRPVEVLDPEHRSEHSKWSDINEIHAEMNALLFASKHGLSVNGATMYVTLSPCIQCAKAIAQSGIKTLVYCETYDKNIPGWDSVLQDNNVNVQVLSKQNLQYLNWENVTNYGGL